MMTIQYGWRGVWHNMGGHGCDSVEAMRECVERSNARDGYERMRVARADSEGERGAPPRPIYETLPMTSEETREFLDLVARGEHAEPSEQERARLRELIDATRGPIIGYESVKP